MKNLSNIMANNSIRTNTNPELIVDTVADKDSHQKDMIVVTLQ